MKLIYVFLWAVLLMPVAMADGLPELGDVSSTVLSPVEEQKISDQIMRDVMSSGDVVSDAEVVDYVQNLGQRLAAASADQRQAFKFFVVKDNTINAFAMPGGVIGVHTGLIVAAKNESEVAGVIGHEIGHVVQHHLARMLARQKQDSIISMAGMALALLAARGSPNLANGAMTASAASAMQNQLDYTREHEREADRVGLQIMSDAGFDPRAMPAFFETLQKGTRFVDGSAPSFLRTHPLTIERIADVRGRVEQMPKREVKDSQEFQYVRAKLLAALDTPQQAVALFESNLQQKQYTNEAAQHYGLARALMRKRDFDGASKQLAWLRTNTSRQPMIDTLAADIAVAQNNPQQAARLYADGLAVFPGHRALIYGYAEHYLATHQYDKALQLIDDKQAMYPDDAYLYELKSRAYTAQGHDLLGHQAQGEAYYRRYNYEGALEQMDLAAKAGDGDFYQRSIVEARLNQLRQLVANQPKT
ncbi:MAG TPA: M48 family metalloprotease [Methylophilaceae bacterium]|nr:M48 family metalloprotease [Methylophilaceae bacterium]